MAIVSIAGAWNSYRTQLLQGADSVQLTETRRAFYAGSAAFFSEIGAAFDGPGPGTAEEELKLLALLRELADFRELVLTGGDSLAR